MRRTSQSDGRGMRFDSCSDERFVKLATGAQRSLFAYILSLVGAAEEAEEILQETNVVLWRKATEFEGRSSFMSWACGVAFKQVLLQRQRQRREHRYIGDDQLLEELAEIAARRVCESSERIEALRRCMQRLPQPARELIDRRYARGKPLGEIASEFKRSAAGLRVTLHRIRTTLADCINRTLAGETR